MFKKVIELNPEFLEAYNGYAQNTRLNLKDYSLATQLYTRIIDKNPDFVLLIY